MGAPPPLTSSSLHSMKCQNGRLTERRDSQLDNEGTRALTLSKAEIISWAKQCGLNVNIVKKYPPKSRAHLEANWAFYTDMSAGFAKLRETQICTAKAVAIAVHEAAKGKYGKWFCPNDIRTLIVSNCRHIFDRGVSPLAAIREWNRDSGEQIACGRTGGYRLSIQAYPTDNLKVALRWIKIMRNGGAGGSCAVVVTWAPEGGCSVKFHALSAIKVCDDCILAMDPEEGGAEYRVGEEEFVQLVICDPIALVDFRGQDEQLVEHSDFADAIRMVARECEKVQC